MSGTPTFHIRGLSEGTEDGQFMIDAFDASLAQLASIGSGTQWGTTPFAERDGIEERTKVFEQAQRYQKTGEGDPIRMFIIEAEVPASALAELPESVHVRTGDAGEKFLAVGSVMLSKGMFPQYLRPHLGQEALKKELDGTSEYIYLEGLVTDFRTGPWRKGAGAVLIKHAEDFCRERGQRILYLDSYAGNNGKLVRYYEGQGFRVIDHFEQPVPDGLRAFYRKDVEP
ncbi:acetyltransferase [Nemania sp. FL0916]|nr:acetyltransferase [Nemania sp. FL0916]